VPDDVVGAFQIEGEPVAVNEMPNLTGVSAMPRVITGFSRFQAASSSRMHPALSENGSAQLRIRVPNRPEFR
jgi:hypothetical protein